MQIRVYYEDTDAGGVVYHTNYLKYCERARSEYFFAKNLSPIVNGAHFVVRKIECDFLVPALFGDSLNVTTDIIELKNSSFMVHQEILRDDKVLFTANIMLVLVKDGRVQKIDKDIKNLLNSLFKN